MKCKNEYCIYMNNKKCECPDEIELDENSRCTYFERKMILYENTDKKDKYTDFDERFLYE